MPTTYDHHSTPALLPAWRVIYGNAEGTRLYLDPAPANWSTSSIRAARASAGGTSRSTASTSGLRERPLWDLVTLALLAGVALVCLLGAWMGVRRLRRKERSHRA
jgi:hypothetical protein